MATELAEPTSVREELTRLAQSFGTEFEAWQLIGNAWRCLSNPDQAVQPPGELLTEAAKNPQDAATGADIQGRGWVAIVLPVEPGDHPQVAVGQLTANAQQYAQRLASQTVATCIANQRRDEQIELLEGYGERLADCFEELTFLRRLSRHVEYCDASRGLGEVAENVLPALCDLMAVDGVALFEANAVDEGHQVGEQIAGAGRLPYNVDLWRDKLGEFDLLKRKTVVRNFSGLNPSSEFFPGVRSIVVTQLVKQGHLFGWLVGINKKQPEALSSIPSNSLGHDEIGSMEASLLEAAAALLTTHAANANLFQEKESLTLDTIHTLVGVLEARDAYTCGHSDRVALVARRLAAELGLTAEQRHGVYLAGLLHDIGKVGVNDDVLLKPGALTDEEFELIKQHPQSGYNLLERLAALGDLLPGVLHHHEAYDGSGYPHGLAGQDIPLAARILAVADAWDAMTSDRPYRKGMEIERAQKIMREGAGRQWDPVIVDAFFAIADEVQELSTSWQDHLQEILSSPSAKSAPQIEFDASLAMASQTMVDVGL